MRKDEVYRLFEGLLYLIEQEKEPEEEETPIEGEEEEEISTEEPEEVEEEVDNQDIDTEEQLSVVDKVYRLKKIYAKLIAISRILDYHSDSKFDALRDEILEAIDLFHILVSNFDSFKDKIDDIIKSYYKLLQTAIEELEKLSKTVD